MIIRTYNCTDHEFIAKCDEIIVTLQKDIAAFQSFSILFNDPFYDNTLALHNECLNLKTDNVYIDEQAESTTNVNNQMDICLKMYRKARFFIDAAFSGKKNIQNQLGYNDYDKARNNKQLMYMFLTDFHMGAEKYKTELNAKGYTQDMIDNILVQRDKLKEMMNIQSAAMAERNSATIERIEKYNSLYDVLSGIVKAAKIIFEEDEVKLSLYSFPVTVSHKKQVDTSTPADEENNNS